MTHYLQQVRRLQRRHQHQFADGVAMQAGEAALLRVPVRALGDGTERAPSWRYRRNARPIFIGPRVFALPGYELVEGAIRGDERGAGAAWLEELGRVDFRPPVVRAVSH